MMMRVILRLIPLFCVAIFTFGAFVVDHGANRAQQVARIESHRLAWATGQVKCPGPQGNLPLSACGPGFSPRITPAPH